MVKYLFFANAHKQGCQTLTLDDDISVTSWSSYLYHLVVTGLRQYAVSVYSTHENELSSD